jgi:hypothetical protein
MRNLNKSAQFGVGHDAAAIESQRTLFGTFLAASSAPDLNILGDNRLDRDGSAIGQDALS